MAVTLVAGGTAEAAASATLTFTLPSGFTVGANDCAVFLCSRNGSSVALTSAPSGVVATPESGSVYGAATATTTYAYILPLTSGVDVPGTTTYAFTTATTGDWQGVVGIYRGVDLAALRRTSAFTTEADVASGTLTPTVLTSLIAGDMVVFGLGARGSGTYTSYTNMTEVGQVASSGTNKRPQGQAYVAIASDGSAPNASAQFSVTANAHGEHSIALAGVAVGGATETLRPDAILEQTNDTKTLADLQRDVP